MCMIEAESRLAVPAPGDCDLAARGGGMSDPSGEVIQPPPTRALSDWGIRRYARSAMALIMPKHSQLTWPDQPGTGPDQLQQHYGLVSRF